MTDQGLGQWLATWGDELALREVTDVVDPMAYEATALLHLLEDEGAPPVRFSAANALDGDTADAALLFNAYGSRQALAACLGLPAESWTALLEGYLGDAGKTEAPMRVAEVPVQERITRGVDVDLRRLPWIRHVAGEGGPYFTPIVVSRAPGSGRYNTSWNRAMYLDPTHVSVHISPRQFWAFQREAEEAGDDLPVAVVLGHHPAFNLTAAALTPMSIDEFEAAGALLGEPLHVAPSITYGDDLLVPADAELVLEGRVLAGRRAVEGPFGEYMRYLGPQKLSHVVEVDAVTSRSEPTVVEIFAAYSDHLNAHVSIHASYLAAARAAVPQVTRVAWFEGGGPTTAVVALEKSAEGQAVRAALAVLGSSNILKKVIVVDNDIDVHDPRKVLWAVSTRAHAAEDVTVLRNLQGNVLDPSDAGFERSSGLIIDATWPLDGAAPPTARVPADALDRFPLADATITIDADASDGQGT